MTLRSAEAECVSIADCTKFALFSRMPQVPEVRVTDDAGKDLERTR